MTYHARVKLYQEIETIRQRPLIVYITSVRANASGQMASDVIPQFTKQISRIPKENKAVDLLIVSLGGDPTVSWRVISMLRERFERVGVLLPYTAFSAATLLALGADEIVMHPYSNLGPVDPQLTVVKRRNDPNGQGEPEEINFAAEDLRNYFDFVKNDVGITDQEERAKAFELVTRDIGAISIGGAKKSSYLALSMGEKLLNMHMKDGSKAKAIISALNTNFYHHGYPVGRREANEIGLPITSPEQCLEALLWSVWESFEDEMQCNDSFNPLAIVMRDPTASQKLVPVYLRDFPPNVPPQVAYQVYSQLLQKIQVAPVAPVQYEQFRAALESSRHGSQFRTKLDIMALRLPDLRIHINVMIKEQRWQDVF
jgi:hypothetical protein